MRASGQKLVKFCARAHTHTYTHTHTHAHTRARAAKLVAAMFSVYTQQLIKVAAPMIYSRISSHLSIQLDHNIEHWRFGVNLVLTLGHIRSLWSSSSSSLGSRSVPWLGEGRNDVTSKH